MSDERYIVDADHYFFQCGNYTHQRLITTTYLYNFDPFKSHLYIVKQGFTWVYIIFSYFCSKIIDCGTY